MAGIGRPSAHRSSSVLHLRWLMLSLSALEERASAGKSTVNGRISNILAK
jgi:hypothetical protein